MRAAQDSSVGVPGPPLGCPTKKMNKRGETLRFPAESRLFTDSGRMLDVLRRSCVSSGLQRWGIFFNLSMLFHFTSSELAVQRWSAFIPGGAVLPHFLPRLVKGWRLNYCDATSRLLSRRVCVIPKVVPSRREQPSAGNNCVGWPGSPLFEMSLLLSLSPARDSSCVRVNSPSTP